MGNAAMPMANFSSRHPEARHPGSYNERTPVPGNNNDPQPGKSPQREQNRSGPAQHAPKRHRTLFLSDIHLGTPGCKAEFLLDFLKNNTAETIYLVGDIVDGWRLTRSWFWESLHNDVIRHFVALAQAGTRIVYIPGNHDEVLREYAGHNFAGIYVENEVIHQTADGRRFLILHGDQFDSVVRYAKWLAHLGDRAYHLALVLNNGLHRIRRRLGLPYWSLSAYLKHKVKNAVEYISNFEVAVAREARERGLDGVICGHIHHAEIRYINGVLYCNDGDWVESCTALCEDASGKLSIMRWTHVPVGQKSRVRQRQPAKVAQEAA
jgi:UDP-2,3-diacylglucosamine pyrophosphatase LpxH